MEYYGNNDWRDYQNSDDYLAHYGVLGMKWGIRRFQPYSTHPRKSGEGGKEIGEARKRMAEGLKRVVKAGARRTKVAIKSLPSRVKKIHDTRKLKKIEAERQKAIEKAVREKELWDNLDKWSNRLSKINNYTNTVLNTVNNVERIREKVNSVKNKPEPSLSEKYVAETLSKYKGAKAGDYDKAKVLEEVAVAQSLKKLEGIGGDYLKTAMKTAMKTATKTNSGTYERTDTTSGKSGNERREYSYGNNSSDVIFGREKGSDKTDTFYGRTGGNVNPKYAYEDKRSSSSNTNGPSVREMTNITETERSAMRRAMDSTFSTEPRGFSSSSVNKGRSTVEQSMSSKVSDLDDSRTSAGSDAVQEIMKKFRDRRG